MGRWHFSAAALAVLPACSLLVSLDGLSGGPGADAGPTGDGDAGLVAPEDGGGPAAEGGDGPAADGGGEAGADPSMQIGLRCADVPDAAFCDDFDTLDLATAWGRTPNLDFGTLAQDGATSTSHPNALLATATPIASRQAAAWIGRDLPSVIGPTRGALDFDLEVDAYGATRSLIAYVNLNDPTDKLSTLVGPQYSLQLALEASGVTRGAPGFRLVEDLQGTGPEKNDSAPCTLTAPAPGTWHHVRFGFDLAVGNESVSIDGGPLCARTLTLAAAHATPYSPQIVVGMPWAEPQVPSSWSIRQDSVVFRVVP